MCCRTEWQERMYSIFTNELKLTRQNMKYSVYIVCNEIKVTLNLEISTLLKFIYLFVLHTFSTFSDLGLYVNSGGKWKQRPKCTGGFPNKCAIKEPALCWRKPSRNLKCHKRTSSSISQQFTCIEKVLVSNNFIYHEVLHSKTI